MSDFKVKPSRRLKQEVAARGSINAAARDFKVEPNTLSRFLEDEGGINGSTIAAIMEATGLAYDELFQHEEAKS